MPSNRDKHSKASSDTGPRPGRSTIRLGKYTIGVPGSRRQRVLLGYGLCLGGVLGFLPIVGFWMLPLGLMVLSVDNPAIRRSRRRLEVRIGRWRKKRKARSANQSEPQP